MNCVLIISCDENNNRKGARDQTLDDAEPVESWHLNIEQEQVGTGLLNCPKSVYPIHAFTDYFYARKLPKHSAKAMPRERFIINDENSKFDHQVRNGIVISTVTPFPLVRLT